MVFLSNACCRFEHSPIVVALWSTNESRTNVNHTSARHTRARAMAGHRGASSLLPDDGDEVETHGVQGAFGRESFKKQAAESSVGGVFYSRLRLLWGLGFPSCCSRSASLLYLLLLLNIAVPGLLAVVVGTAVGPLTKQLSDGEYSKAMFQLLAIAVAILFAVRVFARRVMNTASARAYCVIAQSRGRGSARSRLRRLWAKLSTTTSRSVSACAGDRPSWSACTKRTS